MAGCSTTYLDKTTLLGAAQGGDTAAVPDIDAAGADRTTDRIKSPSMMLIARIRAHGNAGQVHTMMWTAVSRYAGATVKHRPIKCCHPVVWLPALVLPTLVAGCHHARGHGMRSRDEEFAEFAWETSQSESMTDTINHIVNFARDSVDADYAGITLIRAGGELSSMGYTDGAVARWDALQHELHQGPCVDAAIQAHHIAAPDLSIDDRWPRWSKQVVQQGLYSIVSATMHTAGERRLGSLNLYGRRRRQFSSEQLENARLFAAHATAALWSAIREQNLRVALESRTEIGEAAGMLMEKYDLSADQAISVLKRYSQDTNVKLRNIAHEVVEGRRLPHDGNDTYSLAPDRDDSDRH